MKVATMNTVKIVNPVLFKKLLLNFLLAASHLAKCKMDVSNEIEKTFSVMMWKPVFSPEKYLFDFFYFLKKQNKISKKPTQHKIYNWIHKEKKLFACVKHTICSTYGIPTL